MIATAVGSGVAVAALLLTDRFRIPGVLAALGIVVGVVVLGSMVVAPRLSIGPLPSLSGMSVVLRGAVTGWRELLTVATPTGNAGALLVPPLIVGAAATGLAGVLARSARPVTALLAPAAAMVLFALLGSRQVDPMTVAVVAGLSVVVGMSWAVWVGSRLRRRTIAQSTEGNPASSRAASTAAVTRQAIAARRVAISVLVLAVAVLVGTLTATAGTADRLALRDAVERAIDPAAFASPLSVFRNYTKEQADVVQLIATGMPDGARLRLAALDAYDGRQFTVSDGEGPFVRIGPERRRPRGRCADHRDGEHPELRRPVPAASRADHRAGFHR